MSIVPNLVYIKERILWIAHPAKDQRILIPVHVSVKEVLMTLECPCIRVCLTSSSHSQQQRAFQQEQYFKPEYSYVSNFSTCITFSSTQTFMKSIYLYSSIKNVHLTMHFICLLFVSVVKIQQLQFCSFKNVQAMGNVFIITRQWIRLPIVNTFQLREIKLLVIEVKMQNCSQLNCSTLFRISYHSVVVHNTLCSYHISLFCIKAKSTIQIQIAYTNLTCRESHYISVTLK